MATFVIAGKSDCPSFAQVEALADYMAKNLESFEVHKMVVPPGQWSDWLKRCCDERGWNHSSSPLVWRELVDRAGKGLYMGGSTEFFEYAKHYYNLSPVLDAATAEAVAAENCITEEIIKEERLSWRKVQAEPLAVCVTNASSPFAYNFLQWLVSEQTCPPNCALMVQLLVSDRSLKASAEGVAMEMVDCAQGRLHSVTVTTKAKEAFADSKLVVILDEPEGDSGVSVQAYADRLKAYSVAIGKHSHPNVLVAVSGSHANLGATILWKVADDSVVFKKERRVLAVGQTGERRARALIAGRLGIGSHQVEDVVAWGRADCPCLLTMAVARVYRHIGAISGPDDYGKKVLDVVHNHHWVNSSLLGEVQQSKRGPMTAAAGLAQIVQLWMQPTSAASDQLFSIGLISDGQFKLPVDIAFSVPARISSNGVWQTVADFPLSEADLSTLHAEARKLSDEVAKAMRVSSPAHTSNL